MPEDLYRSARSVDSHAEDIQAVHASAHAQIETAQPGLVGLSAAAIAEKAAAWQAVTQAFYAELTARSTAFRTSAVGYETTDDDNARAIGTVGTTAVHGDHDRL